MRVNGSGAGAKLMGKEVKRLHRANVNRRATIQRCTQKLRSCIVSIPSDNHAEVTYLEDEQSKRKMRNFYYNKLCTLLSCIISSIT